MLESDISFTINIPDVGTISQDMNSTGYFNVFVNEKPITKEALKQLHLAIEQSLKIDEAFN